MEKLPPLPINDDARARMEAYINQVREMLDDQSQEAWRDAYYHLDVVMGVLSEYAFGYYGPKRQR